MIAVAWTAIGLLAGTLATLVGAIFQLGSRIDAQGRERRAAIVAQGQGIDSLAGRIDAHVERHAG
jgi:hypothetical protein